MKKTLVYVILWSVSILGIFLYTLLPTDFNIDITGFGQESERTQRQELMQQFNPWDTSMVFMVTKENEFHGFEDLLRWDSCTSIISDWESVRQCISLTDFDFPVYEFYYPKVTPFLPLADSGAFLERWQQLEDFPDITEKFLSADKQIMALYIYPEAGVNQTTLAEEIQQLMSDREPEYSIRCMGISLAAEEMSADVRHDLLGVTTAAILLLIISYLLLTRAGKSLLMLLSFVVFNCSIVFILMYVLGYSLTMLSSVVPAVVAILSFSDIMHIMAHYRQRLAAGMDAKLARKNLFRVIGLPMILTSLSNLIGFLFFLFIGNSSYITEVAILATLGIVFSYASARLLVPLVLTPELTIGLLRRAGGMQKMMRNLQSEIHRRPFVYTGGLVLASLFLLVWLGRNHPVDMHYYSEKDQQEYARSFAMFDAHFQGIRDMEVVLETDMDKMDASLLQTIDQVESYLLDTYGCTSTYSWNTILKRYNRYLHQGRPEYYSLPETNSPRMRDELETNSKDLGVDDVISVDGNQYRIIGSLPDIGTREGNSRNRALEAFLSTTLPPGIEYSLSGESKVFDGGVTTFTQSICLALLLTLLAIGCLMGWVSRSVRVGFLTIWLNLLPLLVALWVMQLMGVDLNPQSVFLLSVIMGVALDDSIYIVGFYSSLKRNGKLHDFHEQVLVQMSFPVWVTTAVLALSFLALSFSSNHLLAAFGVITSVSLGVAFLFDILLLPVLMSKGK